MQKENKYKARADFRTHVFNHYTHMQHIYFHSRRYITHTLSILVSPFYIFNINYDDLIYIMNFNHNENKFSEKWTSIHEIILLNWLVFRNKSHVFLLLSTLSSWIPWSHLQLVHANPYTTGLWYYSVNDTQCFRINMISKNQHVLGWIYRPSSTTIFIKLQYDQNCDN